jgi:Tol biopolymer transport system component
VPQPPPSEQAEFEVTLLTSNPAKVYIGDSVTVGVTVENVGHKAGMYQAILAIDGQIFGEKSISLMPLESGTIEFAVSGLPIGKHTASVGYHETSIEVSPKPTKIAFLRYCGDYYGWEMFTIDSDGSNVIQITKSGKNLWWECPPYGTGTNFKPFSSSLGEGFPVWSPDGTKIAFEQGVVIQVMNADGSEKRGVAPMEFIRGVPTGMQICPSWFPDSQRIAYLDARPLWEIYSINIDGSNLTKHDVRIGMYYGVGGPTLLAVSPDGTSIAFSYCDQKSKKDIYILSLADGKLENLTRNLAGNSFSPTWSPDGTKIAFTLEVEGKVDIYLIDTDGSNARLLVVNGKFPSWQR